MTGSCHAEQITVPYCRST